MLRPLSPASGRAPQRLATRIMRRAGWVALLVWLAALGLGLARMAEDVSEEVEAAAGLALAMAELGRLAAGSAAGADEGAAALDALVQLQRARPLRHLRLQVSDDQGRLLLPAPPLPPDGFGLGRLAEGWRGMAASGGLRGGPDAPDGPPRVQWSLPRPDGRHWMVTLTASPEAERREAVASMLESLGLIAGLAAGLLLAMALNLRHALAPLQRLLAAMAGIERSDTRPVRALPAMPVAELDAVAAGLRHLGQALEEAEAGRRRLAQQVLNLQDDERARLARELHDEFGQRLTALRVDATWLSRRLAASADQADTAAVAQAMAEACGALQQDIRAVLARLEPFAQASAHGPAAGVAVEAMPRLQALLDSLVEGWAAQGRRPQIDAQWCWRPAADAAWLPWQDLPPGLALDRPLALALYRISQEALTNVARHADATTARLRIALEGAAEPGAVLQVDWMVEDDGVGLGDALAEASRRGSGLAGLRERVWALGGAFDAGPVAPGAARTGCRLEARFPSGWRAVEPSEADPG